MVFGGIRERLPGLAAALASGVVFGSLHVFTGITAVPPLIIFGTVLALLYERTGSILPGSDPARAQQHRRAVRPVSRAEAAEKGIGLPTANASGERSLTLRSPEFERRSVTIPRR